MTKHKEYGDGDLLTNKTLNPENDGVTHINISYLARTELGKLLNDSSDLMITYTPWTIDGIKNKEKKTYEFTSYGFMAFVLTGSKDYHLAGASTEYIREHLSYSPIRWDGGATTALRRAYKMRVERQDVWDLLSSNMLPIVSYTMIDGKAVMRKNDQIALEIYNMISKGLSGRS